MDKIKRFWEKIRIWNPVVFLILTLIVVSGFFFIDINETILDITVLFWPILLIVQVIAYYGSGKYIKDRQKRKEYKEKIKNKPLTINKIMKIKTIFLKIFKTLLIITFVVASLIVINDEISYRFGLGDYYEDDYSEESYYEDEYSENDYCIEEDNVLGIIIYGDLYTYDYNLVKDDSEGCIITSAEDVVYGIEAAEQDPNIKAILLEIDSWGGSPTAAKEISDAIKRAQKPTVAVIREAGVSGAYWIATGADVIFANTTSDVGGIGVTMSYLDYSEKNKKDGLVYQQISSGKFKDSGDPDKVLSLEEKKLLQRDVDLLNEIFVSEVASNRNKDISEVEKWADGSTMLGQMALDNGLIDILGDEHNAIDYLEEKLNEDINICWW